MREARVPPRCDLGLLDRRRGRCVRLHGGGHTRGHHVIAAEQRNRAVVFAPAQQPHLQRRRFTQRHADRWRLARRPDQTTRVATLRGARRATEPPIDHDPVFHEVSLPRYRAVIRTMCCRLVRRQGYEEESPRRSRADVRSSRFRRAQFRSDQHRERGATAQGPPQGSASAAVQPNVGERCLALELHSRHRFCGHAQAGLPHSSLLPNRSSLYHSRSSPSPLRLCLPPWGYSRNYSRNG